MLPHELTAFPNSEVAMLRRVEIRNDTDIQRLLHWVVGIVREYNEVIEELTTKLDRLREAAEEMSEEEELLGRPAFGEKDGEMKVVNRILRMHRQGKSLGEIANALNAKRIPTAAGKVWRRQTVSNVVRRYKRQDESSGIP
jgi:Mg2+ and Co2+ transporter CorA